MPNIPFGADKTKRDKVDGSLIRHHYLKGIGNILQVKNSFGYQR